MTLQDVVDELAGALGRPIAIEDAGARVLATSAGRPIGRRSPSRVPEEPGGHVVPDARRSVFPVSDPRGRLAVLRVGDDRLPPLTPEHYSLIGAAVDTVRRLLSPSAPAPGSSRRTELLPGLLAPDAARRREAFAEAVERHWLRRDERTVVRAVLLDGAGGALRRASLARHLDASPSTGLVLLGDERGMLLFVSTEEPASDPADETDAVVRAAAHRHGARVLAIGSARHRRQDDDLRPTADHAALAASIVSSLPDGRDRGDIADLGAWVLLSSVAADSSQLAMLSPAAATLLDNGDDVQRQTVETYLDVRGSVREACAILHIHRTTLYYRLDNLPPTVRAALDDGLARSALHLCLKLMRFRGGHERRRAS
ncbi:helix-turn-helix domain-containing protein [Rathayibacter sp. ZW T2_19]|uniref:Helix-turn-helix domain-containing protein n=1 Tax=Rathayibacter rubneri TaxID=2950106 RepID=A0A9X2E3W0_9MICO|nr:helix-turn-helix domain-containing protein [Rathayibacter rubneri]MCM6763891.1 helix-turn-helix domain-containing protein [Rathayibacter rubneri]